MLRCAAFVDIMDAIPYQNTHNAKKSCLKIHQQKRTVRKKNSEKRIFQIILLFLETDWKQISYANHQ